MKRDLYVAYSSPDMKGEIIRDVEIWKKAIFSRKKSKYFYIEDSTDIDYRIAIGWFLHHIHRICKQRCKSLLLISLED